MSCCQPPGLVKTRDGDGLCHSFSRQIKESKSLWKKNKNYIYINIYTFPLDPSLTFLTPALPPKSYMLGEFGHTPHQQMSMGLSPWRSGVLSQERTPRAEPQHPWILGACGLPKNSWMRSPQHNLTGDWGATGKAGLFRKSLMGSFIQCPAYKHIHFPLHSPAVKAENLKIKSCWEIK